MEGGRERGCVFLTAGSTYTHRKMCEMIWAGRDRDKAIHRGYERVDRDK